MGASQKEGRALGRAGYNDVLDDPSMGWARYVHSMRVFVFNSGLFYMRPTNASMALLDKVAYRIQTENGWDQALFNEVLPFLLAPPPSPLPGHSASTACFSCAASQGLFMATRGLRGARWQMIRSWHEAGLQEAQDRTWHSCSQPTRTKKFARGKDHWDGDHWERRSTNRQLRRPYGCPSVAGAQILDRSVWGHGGSSAEVPGAIDVCPVLRGVLPFIALTPCKGVTPLLGVTACSFLPST